MAVDDRLSELLDQVKIDEDKIGFFGTTAAAQPAHVADPAATAADPGAMTATNPAACAVMTFAAGSIDTGTDMTAAQAAAIVTDLAACKSAADANNAQIDALIVDLTDVRGKLIASIDDIQANNAAIDSILAQLATLGLQASS